MEEELGKLEKALSEAKNNFIELNVAYNEILVKEHEEKDKKNNYRSDNSRMLDYSGAIRTKKTDEEIEMQNVSLMVWLCAIGFIILMHFFSIPFLVVVILTFATEILATIKRIKIRNKYKNNDTKKHEGNEEKLDKDALYEKLYEARKLYHSLKREFESKKINVEMQEKEDKDNTLGILGIEESHLSQIYSEYIDYVRNTFSIGNGLDNKNKVYGLDSENIYK